MGLSTESTNSVGKIYLNIINGKIVKKVNEGTEGAVMRVNKNGKEIWELQFDTLSGKLVDINIENSDYGVVWVFVLKDVDEYYYLHLNRGGRISNGITHRLMNIDFNEDIILKTYRIFNEEKKKDQDYLVVYQGGTDKTNKVPNYFTKETPHGLPKMVQVKVKGNLVWDDGDQIAFIEKMIEKAIKPKLEGGPDADYKSKKEDNSQTTEKSVESVESVETEEEGDGLPWE